MILIYLSTFSLLFGIVLSAKILFPSNVRFRTVNESILENPGEYEDPLNTGSFLYDSKEKPSTPKSSLGLNIQVRNFVPDEIRYFRAHPRFMKCAQQAIMFLRKKDISVEIVAGYKSASSEEYTDILLNEYLRTGCAMHLAIKDGSTGTVQDIASAILRTCPVVVEREDRDLGLYIMSDRVHFHMSAPDSEGPVYKLLDPSSALSSTFDAWVQEEINTGLEPNVNATCDSFSPLANGAHHPENKDQVQAVGALDVAITRAMTKEFGRLVQYQGSSIVFDDSESSSSWCGEQGSPCPQCSTQIKGNSLANRCADRVMTQRLLTFLNKLQRTVRLAMDDKLVVLEAWDESHSAAPDGESSQGDVHYEGRAVKLQLYGDNTQERIAEVSKYAICLSVDFVENRGDHLYLAVKKAQYDAIKVSFPSIDLLPVDAPPDTEHLYGLSAELTENEAKTFPLFDSSGRLDKFIATDITISQFVSPEFRYFRIHRKVVDCYAAIVYDEKSRLKEGDHDVEIEIIRGYLTNEQNRRSFDIIKDKRIDKHNYGLALQLRYKPDPSLPAKYTPYRLLYKVLDKCTLKFNAVKQAIGVGLYRDSVYVDMRTNFHMMEESVDNVPEGVDKETLRNQLEDRYKLVKELRIVDPLNYESACLFANKPEPQSCDFQHVHPESVQRRRRRRSTSQSECAPTRYTKFCSSTEVHRKAVIDEITSMLDRKHYRCRNRTDVLNALNGCFGDCGTCMEGEVYESKQEHCNNLLHWVDWTLMNREPDVTNFFVRKNKKAQIHACEHGADCIENSPLFSLIVPSVEKIYRPDPTKSVEEELYSSVNNPLPAYDLLDAIYGIQAKGIVKFWVKDDSEMTALVDPLLKVVMLYNKAVTSIEVYVEKKNSLESVDGVIQQAANDMRITGCPDVARDTLTPFTVQLVPTEYTKRAAEPPSHRQQIRDYWKNYEQRWAERSVLL